MLPLLVGRRTLPKDCEALMDMKVYLLAKLGFRWVFLVFWVIFRKVGYVDLTLPHKVHCPSRGDDPWSTLGPHRIRGEA